MATGRAASVPIGQTVSRWPSSMTGRRAARCGPAARGRRRDRDQLDREARSPELACRRARRTRPTAAGIVRRRLDRDEVAQHRRHLVRARARWPRPADRVGASSRELGVPCVSVASLPVASRSAAAASSSSASIAVGVRPEAQHARAQREGRTLRGRKARAREQHAPSRVDRVQQRLVPRVPGRDAARPAAGAPGRPRC